MAKSLPPAHHYVNCLFAMLALVQLYANRHFRQYIKQWQVLCDRLRNANKSKHISPCLALLVHIADHSSFCCFLKTGSVLFKEGKTV